MSSSNMSSSKPTNGIGSAAMPFRVLIVDDDFMVAAIHQRLVERDGRYRVVGVAHTAADAMRDIMDAQPDLILLDIYLPDRSGLDVLRAIRGLDADVDVVVISAASDADTVKAVMRLGGFHFLLKPFDANALIEVLDRIATVHRSTNRFDHRPVTQADVDRVYSAMRPPAVGVLPKGLSAVTQQLVLGALASATEQSAAEVAVLTGISRVSARRYLEFLVDAGKVELRLRYGVAGRPEHRYRIIET
jgi:response regulator of citrate/malate metabolism